MWHLKEHGLLQRASKPTKIKWFLETLNLYHPYSDNIISIHGPVGTMDHIIQPRVPKFPGHKWLGRATSLLAYLLAFLGYFEWVFTASHVMLGTKKRRRKFSGLNFYFIKLLIFHSTEMKVYLTV